MSENTTNDYFVSFPSHGMIDAEVKYKLSELRDRADKVKYKNPIPRLPILKKLLVSEKQLASRMQGFYYRLRNWERGLLQLEHPGGLHYDLKVNKLLYTSSSIIENLSGKNSKDKSITDDMTV